MEKAAPSPSRFPKIKTDRWKQTVKRLFSPPGWLTLLLVIASGVSLAVIFAKGWEEEPLAPAAYVLSAYTLAALCVSLGRKLPGRYRQIKGKVYQHPLGLRYFTEAAFRVQVSLYLSLGITTAYSVLKLVTGILYSSLWLGAVAVYYILLSILRFVLLRYLKTAKQDLPEEYRRYRWCGGMLLVLNLSLTGIVFQMVWKNQGYQYPGTLIFAAAAYTFYTVTVSIVDLIKYRKYKSPVLSASKAIRFAAALVSLLSLETAMLAQFGDDESFRWMMTALTGAGVCVIVLGMSVYMLVRSGRAIRALEISREGRSLDDGTS